jgi:hypothetical protein
MHVSLIYIMVYLKEVIEVVQKLYKNYTANITCIEMHCSMFKNKKTNKGYDYVEMHCYIYNYLYDYVICTIFTQQCSCERKK